MRDVKHWFNSDCTTFLTIFLDVVKI